MKIYLIGIGMGNGKTMTEDARSVLERSDAFIGSKRALELVKNIDKPVFESYKPDDISKYLSEHGEYNEVSILLSGDTSFYSGAKRLKKRLREYKTEILPGISSFSYMCAKIGTAIEDTEAVSLHGTDKSLMCRIRDNRYTFALLGRAAEAEKICSDLDAFGLDDCVVHIGSRLGYEDECIINTLPAEYDGGAADPAAMLIENPNNNSFIGKHLSDDEFIRGGVPMTKSEIRALSIAALDAEPNSIVYDIGAGTGSVSIELSLRAHDITVYAIERNEEALKLISENRRKFCADNIKIVNGEAPEALSELPPPDSVFIGGSGGRLDKIIGAVIEKNRDAKIVVNAISLNTASVVIDIAERLCLDVEASLITAAHSKRAGKSMLMFGENPIYIFKLWRKNSDEY